MLRLHTPPLYIEAVKIAKILNRDHERVYITILFNGYSTMP